MNLEEAKKFVIETKKAAEAFDHSSDLHFIMYRFGSEEYEDIDQYKFGLNYMPGKRNNSQKKGVLTLEEFIDEYYYEGLEFEPSKFKGWVIWQSKEHFLERHKKTEEEQREQEKHTEKPMTLKEAKEYVRDTQKAAYTTAAGGDENLSLYLWEDDDDKNDDLTDFVILYQYQPEGRPPLAEMLYTLEEFDDKYGADDMEYYKTKLSGIMNQAKYEKYCSDMEERRREEESKQVSEEESNQVAEEESQQVLRDPIPTSYAEYDQNPPKNMEPKIYNIGKRTYLRTIAMGKNHQISKMVKEFKDQDFKQHSEIIDGDFIVTISKKYVIITDVIEGKRSPIVVKAWKKADTTKESYPGTSFQIKRETYIDNEGETWFLTSDMKGKVLIYTEENKDNIKLSVSYFMELV